MKAATQCTFMVPSDFLPGDKTGLFQNVNSPMESATISYNCYNNGMDKVLTNREKKELEASGQKSVLDSSRSLTKEIYEEQISAAYASEYGEGVGFEVNSFDKITIDGFPGYKIVSTFKPSDCEVVHQTVYMVLSRYRVFTVTYQRAEDDDFEEEFEKSAETIRIR